MTTNELQERLEKEAAFQDSRVDIEPRDRFYYLVDEAFEDYHGDIYAQNGQRVVIVGCADGGVGPVARSGNYAIGIDIAPEAINVVRDFLKKEGLDHTAEAHVMNAEELDFEENSVDSIVCTGVLHHLDIPKAIANWSKVVKPGGRIYMLEPMAANPVIWLYRLLTPKMRTKDEHPLVPADIKLLRERFGEVQIKSYAMTTLLSLPFSYIPKVGNGLARAVKWCLKPVDYLLWALIPPLRYCAWTWYIKCTVPEA